MPAVQFAHSPSPDTILSLSRRADALVQSRILQSHTRIVRQPVRIRAAAQITSRLTHAFRNIPSPNRSTTIHAAAAVTARYPAPCITVAVTPAVRFVEAPCAWQDGPAAAAVIERKTG